MKKIIFIVAFYSGIILTTASCDNGLDIQQSYDFNVTTLPVKQYIKKGETVELRCRLVRSGYYQFARYYVRYFQPSGAGELKNADGLIFQPNDLYELKEDTFRLYYKSLTDEQQVLDLYFQDEYEHTVHLAFTFNNDSGTEEEGKTDKNHKIIF